MAVCFCEDGSGEPSDLGITHIGRLWRAVLTEQRRVEGAPAVRTTSNLLFALLVLSAELSHYGALQRPTYFFLSFLT